MTQLTLHSEPIPENFFELHPDHAYLDAFIYPNEPGGEFIYPEDPAVSGGVCLMANVICRDAEIGYMAVMPEVKAYPSVEHAQAAALHLARGHAVQHVFMRCM